MEAEMMVANCCVISATSNSQKALDWGIPDSPSREYRVEGLADVVLGRWTAAAIGWMPEVPEEDE